MEPRSERNKWYTHVSFIANSEFSPSRPVYWRTLEFSRPSCEQKRMRLATHLLLENLFKADKCHPYET